MTELWAYRAKIDTGTVDEEGLLLFVEGKLIACLVRLADECHGHLRGQWCIEAAFRSETSTLTGTTHLELDDAIVAIAARLPGLPPILSGIRSLPL